MYVLQILWKHQLQASTGGQGAPPQNEMEAPKLFGLAQNV